MRRFRSKFTRIAEKSERPTKPHKYLYIIKIHIQQSKQKVVLQLKVDLCSKILIKLQRVV